jgi:hypothetical protein
MAAAITSAVLPTALTGAVYDRSDGIPLHVEERRAQIAAWFATQVESSR